MPRGPLRERRDLLIADTRNDLASHGEKQWRLKSSESILERRIELSVVSSSSMKSRENL